MKNQGWTRIGCAVVPLRRTAPDDQGHTARTWRETKFFVGPNTRCSAGRRVSEEEKRKREVVCIYVSERKRRERKGDSMV